MLHYFKEYLRFLWRSTNQHGVHSPFMYAYTTKCLYQKSKHGKGSKAMGVFLKSKAYFKTEKVKLITENGTVNDLFVKGYGMVWAQTPPFDLVYIDRSAQHRTMEFLSQKESTHNGTMVLLEGIHASNEARALWKKILGLPYVTVTIDMFCCGAFFFRKEQAPEHFTIRI